MTFPTAGQSFTSNGSGGFSFSIFAPPPQQPPQPEVFRSSGGAGYPSASRALARIPPNTYDPNGYYKALGIESWSTDAQVKSAIRKMMRKYHPDANPDATEEEAAANAAMFARIKEIAATLLDPMLRAAYHALGAAGRTLIDSEVKQQMADEGIAMDDPDVKPVADSGAPPKDPEEEARRARAKLWDYLAVDDNPMDLINAQEWYGYLLEVAPMFRYDATIKILLHDGSGTAWKKIGGIMLIPRVWEPSKAQAWSMMMRHLGWPKFHRPTPQEPLRPGWQGTGFNGGGGLLAIGSPNVSGAC